MKIADDGNVAARVEQAFLDFRHRGGSFWHVHGDADKFRARLREFEALLCGGRDVGGVRVGHGLNDDGRASAHLNFADLDADCLVPLLCHGISIVSNWRTNALAGRYDYVTVLVEIGV